MPNKCHPLVLFHGFLDYYEQPVCLSLSMHLGSQRSRRHLTKLCPSPHSTLILLEKLRKRIQWINVGATLWAPLNSKCHKRKPVLPSWVMSWRSWVSSSAGWASARLVLSLLKLLICIAVIILQNIFTSIFSLDSPWYGNIIFCIGLKLIFYTFISIFWLLLIKLSKQRSLLN